MDERRDSYILLLLLLSLLLLLLRLALGSKRVRHRARVRCKSWRKMRMLGQHSLFDLHGCDPALLADERTVRLVLLDAVRKSGGTIVTDFFHQFSPHGVSGVVVIAESHLAIHTWPERGFAAVDLFTCSTALDHEQVEKWVASALAARRVDRRIFPRGQWIAVETTELESG